MSDSRNLVTGGFVVAAIALSIAAFVVYPKVGGSGMEGQINKQLFEFEPGDVRSLTIEKYDSEKSVISSLTMEKTISGGWRIPSKDNYPVESSERLVSAAASLTGLVVLDIVPENPDNEVNFGVMEPAPGLPNGQKGVGVKVTLRDREKQEIASAIIGKPVKDAPTRRFIRIPEQRVIYICEFDPSTLNTDAFSWIETKILDVGTQWFVKKLEVDRYQALLNPLPSQQKDYFLAMDSTEGSWRTNEFEDSGKAINPPPKIDSGTSERLRVAISNFQISDVEKKSSSLAQSLIARKGIPNAAHVVNPLRKKGIFVNDKVEPIQTLGAGGAFSFSTSEGLRYDLLFGTIFSQTASGRDFDQRWVMISVDIDATMFPMPDAPKKKSGDGAPNPNQEDEDFEARRQYQIKLNERKERVAEARKTADELNQKFANWFYLIHEDLYKHLVPAKKAVLGTLSQ